MASVEITYDDSGLQKALEIEMREFSGAGLREKLNDIGKLMVASTDKNFQSEGRPTKWPSLSEATLKRRRTGPKTGFGKKILQNMGASGLKGSITYGVSADGVEIGTSVDYGKYHQTGTRKMPQRVFLMFQDQDIERIIDILSGDTPSGASQRARAK